MSSFRVATINVHSFNSPQLHGNNIDHLVSILEPLNLDLICLQEVRKNDKWQTFCQKISLPYFIFGQADGSYLGNGIISRYPIQSSSNQRTNSACEGGRRALLQCQLDGDHPFIQNRIFAVTHLDHFNEDNRLEQIKEFNPYEQNVDILMGDMNALTRDDYSHTYYQQAVESVRLKNRWEKPRFDLTNLITQDWNYQDAFKLKNPEIKDQNLVTCRFGTRIDYIYIHPRVMNDWILSQCSIINTDEATDHNIVFAEFTQISK